MEQAQTSKETRKKTATDWLSIWQAGLGTLAALFAVMLFLLFSFSLLIILIDPGATTQQQTLMSLLLLSSSVFFFLISLANVALGGLRLAGRPVSGERLARLPQGWLVLALAIFVSTFFGLGVVISNFGGGLLWLLPPVHVLVAVGTITLLGWLALHGLKAGSPQRVVGAFSSGLMLSPLVGTLLELFVAVLVMVGVILYAASEPDLWLVLERVGIYYQSRPNPDMAQVQQIISPLLKSPPVFFWALFYFSLCVPLIEELLKPLAVWLLAGRRLTPKQGFAIGVLSGLGFATFENLSTIVLTEGWGIIVAARVGTALMHMLTTGLMGWALALAWEQKRYGRLVLTYLGVVALHGFWNGLELLRSFSGAIHMNGVVDAAWIKPYWQWAGLIAFFVIALGVLIGFIWLNRYWQRADQLVASSVQLEVEE